MSKSSNLYRHYHFQAQIICYCIWLYKCYWLVRQNFQEMIAQSEIAFYKPIRYRYKQVWLYFLDQFQFCSQPADKWNLGETILQLNNGRIDAHWQTVNRDGNLLSVLMQSRRDQMTVRFWFRPLLKKLCNIPLVAYNLQLKSHSLAKRATPASVGYYTSSSSTIEQGTFLDLFKFKSGNTTVQLTRLDLKEFFSTYSPILSKL